MRTSTGSSSAERRPMNKLFVASLPLLLAGGAATAFALSAEQHARTAPRVEAAPALPGHGRIALTQAQVREAYTARLIDRPIRSILDVRKAMSYGEFVWNDEGVPAGPAWIRVDLHAQLMSVFRSGHEIGTAVILYGADGLPTPTGKFPILAKLKDRRAITYEQAPRPDPLRLPPDGVWIHGSSVRWRFATHGCISIPKA